MKLLYTPFDHLHAIEAVINYAELRDRIEPIAISPFADDVNMLVSHNPLGTVPTLISDDGTAYFGGPVAYEFLDSLHAKRRLFPDDPETSILVRRRLWVADAIFDNTVRIVIESWEPADTIRKQYLARTWSKIARSLDYFEEQAGTFGTLDIGQLRLVTALQYLGRKLPSPFADFVEDLPPTYEWQSHHETLAKWYDETHRDPIFHRYLDAKASASA